MDLNLSNQEQKEWLKNWWKKYGNYILLGVLVFLTINYGWQFWGRYKAKQAEVASVTYIRMVNLVYSGKKDEANLLAQHLIKDYKRTPYADFAAFMQAKEAVLRSDFKTAEKKLVWIKDNSRSSNLRDLAKIKLARVFMAMKKLDAAEQVLLTVRDQAFLSFSDEIFGDIFLMQGKKDEAIKAYKKALFSGDNLKTPAPILRMKLQELGG